MCRFRLRQSEFSTEFTTGLETRICPYCSAEDQNGQQSLDVPMRHRRFWRLSAVCTHSRHGTFLRDIRLKKWGDQLHELLAMRDLIEAELLVPKNVEPEAPSPFQAYVEDRLEGHSGPSWLDEQDIHQASRAVEMLGGLIAFGPRQKAAEMTLRKWDEAGRFGWGLVVGGEADVAAFPKDRARLFGGEGSVESHRWHPEKCCYNRQLKKPISSSQKGHLPDAL